MNQSKPCRKCSVVKPLDGFHRQSSSKDGRQAYCRECNSRVAAERKAARKGADPAYAASLSKYRAEHYARNKEAQKASARAWREANPARVAATQAAYLSSYPERRMASHRRYREANPDKRHAGFKAWSQANPESSRIRGHRRRARLSMVLSVPYTPEQLASRLAYFGGKCWMCGSDGTSIDHVKPISRGGADALSNLRPACKPCNSGKRDRWYGVANLTDFIRT